MTWNAHAAARALRIEGLDLADPEAMPRDLGKGRYEVAVVSRIQRDPAGTRVVVFDAKGECEIEKAPKPKKPRKGRAPQGGGWHSW